MKTPSSSTPKEIAESNKMSPIEIAKKRAEALEQKRMIAEFDGWYQKPEINKGSDINWFHPQKSTQITDAIWVPRSIRSLKYDTDWSWLMPVVRRICFLKDLSDIDHLNQMALMDTPIFSKIETTYQATIQFIKYYNQKPL